MPGAVPQWYDVFSMSSATSHKPRVGIPYRTKNEQVTGLSAKLEKYLEAVRQGDAEPVPEGVAVLHVANNPEAFGREHPAGMALLGDIGQTLNAAAGRLRELTDQDQVAARLAARAALHSACGEYIAPPSPTKEATQFRVASAAPTAAGMLHPSTPPRAKK